MTVKIINIQPRAGVSRDNAYESIKKAMGFTTIQEASKFFETMMGHYKYDIEEEALPYLNEAFTFELENEIKDNS